jgi:photosystem II stability/assembly factor-like uncharacterized protein
MKTFFLVLFSLILVGAGCARGNGGSTTDGGVYKTINSGQDWSQAIVVPTAAGIGTLATTDVLNMEMDPQDRSFIYIGTRQNGMLYSEDSGASWRQPRASALKEGLVYKIAVSPLDSCTVYIAKGPRLFGTDDCMRTWDSEIYVDSRAEVGVVQIAPDWYDKNVIWIGLSNGDVLKSADAGRSWRTVLTAGKEISTILIHNKDSRNVLVSTFNKGVYKTRNSGDDWEQVEEGLEDLKKADRVFSMTQDKGSQVVIAATAYGLHRSRNFGDSWEAIGLVTSPGQVEIRALGLDANDADTIYYAANGTFYSSKDSGATWSTDRLPSSRVPRGMIVDPADPSVVYVAVATATEK